MAGNGLPVGDRVAAGLATRMAGEGNCGTPGFPTVVDLSEGGQGLIPHPLAPGASLTAKLPGYLAAHPDVTTVAIEIGMNDLWNPAATVAAFAAAYTALIAAARAQVPGLRVIVCTVTPLGAAHPQVAARDPLRRQYNSWLLSASCPADAVARWDEQVDCWPRIGRLDPAYDSGDHMHPNAYGALRLFRAIPLDQVR
jgi:lysophospholipase L1-like esterase